MLNRIFDVWVQFMLRHRLAVLALVALITVGLGAFVARLPLISALPDYIPASQLLTAWEEARERFGGDEIALLAIEADDRYPYVSSLWNDFIRIVMSGTGPSADKAKATFSLPG